jgi:hypothetical protein
MTLVLKDLELNREEIENNLERLLKLMIYLMAGITHLHPKDM